MDTTKKAQAKSPSEVVMNHEADQTRRWLLNTSGGALLSSIIPVAGSPAEGVPERAPVAPADTADGRVSPAASTLADYVAKTLDRELPAEVVVRTKLHVFDTIAAIVSGSRLKAGELAA